MLVREQRENGLLLRGIEREPGVFDVLDEALQEQVGRDVGAGRKAFVKACHGATLTHATALHVGPMTTTHNLGAILHDGDLESVLEAGDVCTLFIDVPHVRKHQGHEKTQRYQLRCEGVSVRTFSVWEPPADPRPEHPSGIDGESRAKADVDWFARGTFVTQDWSRFVQALATKEGRYWLIEASLDEGTSQVLKLRGNIGNDWGELAVEARVIVLTETSGKVHTVAEFIALGDAYWEAWSAKG